MSSPHADDVFTIRFDDAVESMHQHTYRGSKPTAGLWNDIRSQMHPENATMAAPNPTPEHVAPRRRSAMINTQASVVRPGSGSRTPRRNASAWIALALVMMLVASGLYLNQALQRDTSDQQIAWAPGTTTSNPNDEIMVASPPASPSAIEYGPEFACNVEPLTADEVFLTVLNPENGYERLGANTDTSRKYEESRGAWPQPLDQTRMMMATRAEEMTVQGAVETAEVFWNCLLTGTAYQVWALTSPNYVQAEVLLNLPVVRSEQDIRAFIEKWGPNRYSVGPSPVWPRLSNQHPEVVGLKFEGSIVPIDGYSGVLVGLSNSENREVQTALVILSNRDISDARYVEISLRIWPTGEWTVEGYEVPGTMG